MAGFDTNLQHSWPICEESSSCSWGNREWCIGIAHWIPMSRRTRWRWVRIFRRSSQLREWVGWSGRSCGLARSPRSKSPLTGYSHMRGRWTLLYGASICCGPVFSAVRTLPGFAVRQQGMIGDTLFSNRCGRRLLIHCTQGNIRRGEKPESWSGASSHWRSPGSTSAPVRIHENGWCLCGSCRLGLPSNKVAEWRKEYTHTPS